MERNMLERSSIVKGTGNKKSRPRNRAAFLFAGLAMSGTSYRIWLTIVIGGGAASPDR